MLLIEADGKALFAGARHSGSSRGCGDGCGAGAAGRWAVDGEGAGAGGRARQGGRYRSLRVACRGGGVGRGRMLGSRLKGHAVDACLVEAAASGQERYISVMVDAASYGLRVIFSSAGGVEIEESGSAQGRLCAPHPGEVAEALADLIADEPTAWRDQVAAIGKAMATLLIEKELALVEINPLFVSEAGCVAGDAKVVVDLNAVGRQPAIASTDCGSAGHLHGREPQNRRRVRLCRTRSGRRNRLGNDRGRVVDDADR